MAQQIEIKEETFEYLKRLTDLYGWQNFIVGGSFSMNAMQIINRPIGDLDLIVMHGSEGSKRLFGHFLAGQNLSPYVQRIINVTNSGNYGQDYSVCEVNQTEHKKFKVKLGKPDTRNWFKRMFQKALPSKIVEVCIFKYLGTSLEVFPCEVQRAGSDEVINVLLGHPSDAIKAKEQYIKEDSVAPAYGRHVLSKSYEKHMRDIKTYQAHQKSMKYQFARACISAARGNKIDYTKKELDELSAMLPVFGAPMNNIQKKKMNEFITKFKKYAPVTYKSLYTKYVTNFGFDAVTFTKHGVDER